MAIPGHNLMLATLGVLILWFGWFGFNPGSTMGAAVNDISLTAANTNLAAAAAAIGAVVSHRESGLLASAKTRPYLTMTHQRSLLFGKPDLTMTLVAVRFWSMGRDLAFSRPGADVRTSIKGVVLACECRPRRRWHQGRGRPGGRDGATEHGNTAYPEFGASSRS